MIKFLLPFDDMCSGIDQKKKFETPLWSEKKWALRKLQSTRVWCFTPLTNSFLTSLDAAGVYAQRFSVVILVYRI